MTNKADFIRLNLELLSDLPDMLVSKAKDFYDIDVEDLCIKVKYDAHVSNSHGAPIKGKINWGGRNLDAPRNYPGWRGWIEANVKSNGNGRQYFNYAVETLFGHKGFTGFHCGGGMPGKSNGESKMNIAFYFFIDDFPLLKSSLEKWKILRTFEISNRNWPNLELNYGQSSW